MGGGAEEIGVCEISAGIGDDGVLTVDEVVLVDEGGEVVFLYFEAVEVLKKLWG